MSHTAIVWFRRDLRVHDHPPLRAALDAALSSPSGRGVVVDADERFLGTVSASQVLARIEEQASTARTARSTLAVGSEA